MILCYDIENHQNEKSTFARIADMAGVIPSVNGKIELVYEGEQEGAAIVAENLLGRAIRNQFVQWFPDPGKLKKKKQESPYQSIVNWFGEGNTVDYMLLETDKDYSKILKSIPGLAELVEQHIPRLN